MSVIAEASELLLQHGLSVPVTTDPMAFIRHVSTAAQAVRLSWQMMGSYRLSSLDPKQVAGLSKRYKAGEKLTDLAAEVGVTWQVLAGHFTKLGGEKSGKSGTGKPHDSGGKKGPVDKAADTKASKISTDDDDAWLDEPNWYEDLPAGTTIDGYHMLNGTMIEKFSAERVKANRKLSSNERDMLEHYSDIGSKEINGHLRKYDDAAYDDWSKNKTIRLMDSAVRKNQLPFGLFVFRGQAVNKNPAMWRKRLRPGRTFVDKGFVSTTLHPGITIMFGANGGFKKNSRIVFSIRVPKGTPTAYIAREKELVLPRSSTFKVRKLSNLKQGVTLVELDWIGVSTSG